MSYVLLSFWGPKGRRILITTYNLRLTTYDFIAYGLRSSGYGVCVWGF